MSRLDENYKAQSLKLRAATLRDLRLLWPALNLEQMDKTFPGWAAAVSALIQRDRRRVAGLTSAYLYASRMASGVPGDPVVSLAGPAPAAQVATSLEVTAKAGYYTALRYYPPQKAADVAFVRTAGSVGKLVLNAGRETVMESLKADPAAAGWRRVASPTACNFCKAIAGKGYVYSAETADFAAHDHCGCSAEAVYGAVHGVRAYTPSQRFRSQEARDKHNARTRDWLASL